MTEALGTEQAAAFDSRTTYPTETCPTLPEQQTFFQDALLQADDIHNAARERNGPLIGHFKQVLMATQQKLQELDPRLTPEYLAPTPYQSEAVKQDLQQRSYAFKTALEIISDHRLDSIDAVARTVFQKHLAQQHVPAGILDTPPYCRQGDGWDSDRALRNCVNACFRMVFGGIAGWVPNEGVVAESFIAKYGSPIVADEEYHKFFKTASFEALSRKKVHILDFVGADFALITGTASRIRERIPGAQVYCVVSLASAIASRRTWHANVLLETTNLEVVCHDPSDRGGQSYKHIPREDFTQRWAAALNRAQIYIAAG